MNPQEQQQFQANWLKSFMSGAQQPQANLQQTQAETEAAGASAGLSSQETQNSALQTQQTALELQKIQAFNSAHQQLQQAAGSGTFVTPQVYNSIKEKLPSGLIPSSEFDNTFNNFIDPNQAYAYNSDQGRALQQKRAVVTDSVNQQVNDILSEYDKIGAKGPQYAAVEQYHSPGAGVVGALGSDIENLFPGISHLLGLGGSQDVYEQKRATLSKSIDELNGVASTPGIGLNPADIAQVKNDIPAIGDPASAVKTKLASLNDTLTKLTGKGISPSLLKQYGLLQDNSQQNGKGGDILQDSLNNILGINSPNAYVKQGGTNLNDILNIGKGMVSQAGDLGNKIIKGEPVNNAIGDEAVQSGKSYVNSLQQLLGIQTKGNKPLLDPTKSILQPGGVNAPTGINLMQGLQEDVQHPVNAFATLAPLLGLRDMAGVDNPPAEPNIVPGENPPSIKGGASNVPGNPTSAQRTVNTLTDLLKGGGTKDNVLNSAKYGNNITENQVMNELGVNNHPTQTGKLQAMQGGLTRYGSSLGNIYSSSKEVITGDNLTDKLTQSLTNNGVPLPDATKIVTKVTGDLKSNGYFDLSKGDSVINMKQLWNGAKWLEGYKPIIKGDADATAYLKQNSQSLASTMRQELASKVPDSQPYAARYGILKNAIEKAPSPSGIDMQHGLMRSLLSGATNAGEVPLNRIYQLLGGGPLPQVESANMQQFSPDVVQNNAPFQTNSPELKNVGENQTMNLLRDKRMKIDNPKALRVSKK